MIIIHWIFSIRQLIGLQYISILLSFMKSLVEQSFIKIAKKWQYLITKKQLGQSDVFFMSILIVLIELHRMTFKFLISVQPFLRKHQQKVKNRLTYMHTHTHTHIYVLLPKLVSLDSEWLKTLKNLKFANQICR